MKKVLFIMAAALMTMTQCRKQETMPVTPSANTIKMTVTAGSGAKTDINTETGAITWSEGDKLYVSDGTNWLGSLTLVGEGGSAQGTFTGSIAGIGEGDTPCHFFYLGHDNGMAEPTGTAAANISFAAQDGTLRGENGAMKYHAGYGTTDVTVESGEYQGYVLMNTKIAIAHINFTKDSQPYTGAVTMGGTGISNTLSVSPDGSFSGGGDGGITIGNGDGESGERYVTLIPTTETGVLNVAFTGDATGSMTFLAGIHENKFYGMKDALTVTLTSANVPVEGVSLSASTLSLEVGATDTLTATVAPDNATDPSVTWSSSATGVATVSDAGVVTAVAAGEATITVTTNDGGKTATCTVTVTKPKPTFTVDANGTTVEFAPGNLYYDGTASKWKFEANQWDFRTYKSNGSCINGVYSQSSGTPTNDWGLFGWSTSASNNNYGMHTKTTATSGYTDGNFKDWGGLAIGNDPANTWRTLSYAEWDYLLNTRTDASSLREWVTLTDVGVSGLVILPDKSTTTASSVTTKDAIASSDAVFLPAAGYRKLGTIVTEVGSASDYWSATHVDADRAYSVSFWPGSVMGFGMRQLGYAVRLVRDAE